MCVETVLEMCVIKYCTVNVCVETISGNVCVETALEMCVLKLYL